ncbi:membrane bound O-acyl transferase family-domain-containing protein [Aspergillus ambiguus]|uniref:wax synthase family protein n=1 Tax=Aspergillus ambiguus TaxID=176160 RepID=UPI003CCDED95
MANPLPPSYLHIIHNNRIQFEVSIQQGQFKPVFLWQTVLLIALPLLALAVPRRYGGHYVRYLVFGLVVQGAIDTVRSRRALLGANGYMVGLIVAWWSIWMAALLVFHDPELEFRRIERVPLPLGKRALRNGQDATDKDHLTWQPYPTSIMHRLNWVLGLLLNMRGPEWNWRISSLDPLPSALVPCSAAGEPRPVTPEPSYARSRLRAVAATFIKTYLALDLIKLLMMHDPYFWGVVGSSSLPPPFPLTYLIPLSSVPSSLIYLYRFLLTGTAIYTAVVFVGTLNPLIFLGLSHAFPSASRMVTSTPLNAPWLYADLFGPLLPSALDHGLAGCWSRWWHQVFRFGFTSTAHALVSLLPARCTAHRGTRRGVVAVVVFTLSGLMHACGSYTQFSPTHPISGPFLFFILQPVGIAVQEMGAKWLLPAVVPGGAESLPRWVRRTANVIFVASWLLFSARYIMDDFARGGFWLAEPLPISLFRGFGLGLGVEGEGWWCWGEPWFHSWDGGSFWTRGVRVM